MTHTHILLAVHCSFCQWTSLSFHHPWLFLMKKPTTPGPNFCRGEIIYTPPPPPISGPKPFFRGGGLGVYILRPHAVGILYAPPPFYTPPTPRRVFSGVRGWGCIKFGPVLLHSQSYVPDITAFSFSKVV